MNDVAQLEQQMSNAKDLIARRTDALQLSNNRLFRKVILDDFCVQEAARLVHMSSDPALTADQRADALAMAQAGGHLRRYLSMMVQMGAVAERDMPNLEEALAEARAEGEVEHDDEEDGA